MRNNLYQYICIEGNLGAGKTSFCEKVAKTENCELVLEQFSDNPFLPLFYEDPDRYALTVELFFMTERYKQLQKHSSQRDMFRDFILSDYIFHKTFLFANNNLSPDEMRLFKSLFNILQQSAPTPELLIYLDRPVDRLASNIHSRNRPYELKISEDYLLKVQHAYTAYLKTALPYPRIIVRLGDTDFLNNEDSFLFLLELMDKKYEKKMIEIEFV